MKNRLYKVFLCSKLYKVHYYSVTMKINHATREPDFSIRNKYVKFIKTNIDQIK